MQRATAQRMNQALPRALCSLFPAASRALTWRAHERERDNSRRRKERRRRARWRAREGRRRTRATTERKRWSFFFLHSSSISERFFFDNFESVTHPLFSNASFFFVASAFHPSFVQQILLPDGVPATLSRRLARRLLHRPRRESGVPCRRRSAADAAWPPNDQCRRRRFLFLSRFLLPAALRPLRDAPDAPGARRQTARQQWLGLDAGEKALAPPPPGRRECFGRVCFGVGAVVRANIVVGARRRQRRRFRALWLFRRRALRPRR